MAAKKRSDSVLAIAIMNGLVMGVIYALAALGVSLVVGIMNVSPPRWGCISCRP